MPYVGLVHEITNIVLDNDAQRVMSFEGRLTNLGSAAAKRMQRLPTPAIRANDASAAQAAPSSKTPTSPCMCTAGAATAPSRVKFLADSSPEWR